MGILFSRGGCHIQGHKELTHGKKIITLTDPKAIGKIYIPLVSGNGKELLLDIKEGDYVKKGTRIGVSQGFYVPVFSPVSGFVSGTEKRFNSLTGRPVDHYVIDNAFKYETEESLKKYDYDKVSSEEIVEAIKEAGIVGLGGAGFPTYIKYGAKNIKTILINACECEPYLTTDNLMVVEETETMLKGISLMMRASQAKKAIIAFKEGHSDMKEAILKYIDSYPNIEIKEVKDRYPAGWERTLVWNVFKKEYENLPSEIGVIVNNAQTAMAVAKAVLEGKPITERVVTVSGTAIKEPQNIRVPVGTVVSKIIEACGGYKGEQVFLLAGGPMCSKAQMNDQFVVEKQSGGYTVLFFEEIEAEPCLRCGACTLHCPASLQPVEIKEAVEKKDEKRLQDLKVNSCIECGLCTFVCPSRIMVTESIRKAKLMLKIAAAKAKAAKK
ncbi:RnfABCDGE type electron transport complex subunit C [bacterium]|nr:RnfABCDGE type electron transport complex subunit C [bacterium]